MDDPIGKGTFLPIEWYFPDDLISQYATNLLVQHSENDYYLSFFEMIPPVLLGTDEEKDSQLKQIESVRAKCVARIIVSGKKLPGFVKAIQDNLERFQGESASDESE